MTNTKQKKMDAVVLAGTHLEKDKLIHGQNKSFLDLHGKPVVQYVIEALKQTKYIDRIVVVGPEEKLNYILKNSSISFIPVKQAGQLINNGWISILALFENGSSYPTDILEYFAALEEGTFQHPKGAELDKAFLFISGDVPLCTSTAIDDFIERCDLMSYDMFYGVSEDKVLKAFYPTNDDSGIKRPYVNFSNIRVRVSNIQIIKPFKLGYMQLIQSAYSIRKLKKWRNLFRLLKLVITLPFGLRSAWFIAKLQISAKLYKFGLNKWAKPIRKRCHIRKLEWFVSKFLQTRFKIVTTPFGGLSIDIDNEDDYELLKIHFDKWLSMQNKAIDENVT